MCVPYAFGSPNDVLHLAVFARPLHSTPNVFDTLLSLLVLLLYCGHAPAAVYIASENSPGVREHELDTPFVLAHLLLSLFSFCAHLLLSLSLFAAACIPLASLVHFASIELLNPALLNVFSLFLHSLYAFSCRCW